MMVVEFEEVAQAFDDYVDTLGEFLEHNEFSDEEIDAYFLEHFGVRGMKWGVRKKRNEAERAARFSDKTKRNLKIGAGVVAGTAAVAAGTLITARFILTGGGRHTLSQISNSMSTINQGAQAVNAIRRTPQWQRNVDELNAARETTNRNIQRDWGQLARYNRSQGVDLPLNTYRWEQGADW